MRTCSKCGRTGHYAPTCDSGESAFPLRALLDDRGLMPSEVADAIGYSRGAFNEVVRGRTPMGEDALARLAKHLDAQVGDVVKAYRIGRVMYSQAVARQFGPPAKGRRAVH